MAAAPAGVGDAAPEHYLLGRTAAAAPSTQGDQMTDTVAPTVVKTDEEWREQLGELAYRVTRQHATERPFSHDNFANDAATYTCICCGAPLFDQEDKFDAGCGWPSFSAPLDDTQVGESVDNTHGMVRTEVHCNRCGAHLGHVFPDGPRPTGLRYCINGVALGRESKD
jgi:peptide-methionine (R)-S-oxide reductase